MPEMEIKPYVESFNDGTAAIKFEFKYDNFKSKGSLINLPTITETHKTSDFINLFKSNDIS